MKSGVVVLSLELNCESAENKVKDFGLNLENVRETLIFYIESSDTEWSFNSKVSYRCMNPID